MLVAMALFGSIAHFYFQCLESKQIEAVPTFARYWPPKSPGPAQLSRPGTGPPRRRRQPQPSAVPPESPSLAQKVIHFGIYV